MTDVGNFHNETQIFNSYFFSSYLNSLRKGSRWEFSYEQKSQDAISFLAYIDRKRE